MRRLCSIEFASGLFAAVFTLCMGAAAYFSIGYLALGLSTRDLNAWMTPGVLACFIAGAVAVFFAALAAFNAISRAIERCSTARRDECPESYRASLHARFWKCFLVLVICWTPWIIAHLPGAFDEDTLWQLTIWRLPQAWTDHNPWLTTVIFGTFLDFGRSAGDQGLGLIVYGILQTMLTAASLSAALCYLARFKPPRALFVSCIVCLCIFPCFASYASEMVKDSLFAWPWVLFSIGFIEIVRTRGRCLKRPIWLVGLTAVCLMLVLTRKTGIYIILPSLAVALFLVDGPLRTRLAVLGLVPLAFLILWSAVLLPSWGVAGTEASELIAQPLQQTSRCVVLHGDAISDEDRAIIDEVVSYQAMEQSYNPFSVDPVKDTYKNPDDAQIADYLNLWLRMGFRYPDDYAAGAFNTSLHFVAPWFCVDTKNEISPKFLDDYGRYFASLSLEGSLDADDDAVIGQLAAQNTEGLASSTALTPLRNFMNGYETVLDATPLRLIDSMAFMAVWLPFFMFCYGLRGRTRPRIMLACLMPSGMLLLTLLASPVSIGRYALPGIDAAILVACLPFVFAHSDTATAESSSS